MKQSYCGLCENCPIDMPDFLKAITKVREYFDQFPVNWWVHCFPEDEGFSFPEFRKGLDWFLSHPECLGCNGGKGPKDCPIRLCAMTRPFFTTKKEGIGLGLVMVKNIISAHQGQVKFFDNQNSPGVTFRIVLPFEKRQPMNGART